MALHSVLASNTSSKKQGIQKAALCLLLTDSEAPDVFNSFWLTHTEQANYENVVQQFEE